MHSRSSQRSPLRIVLLVVAVLAISGAVGWTRWALAAHTVDEAVEWFLYSLLWQLGILLVAVLTIALYKGIGAAVRSTAARNIAKGLKSVARGIIRPWPLGIITFIVSFMVLARLLPATTCNDGWHSGSIGSRGACSWHGGVDNTWVILKTLISTGVAIAVGKWRRRRIEAVEQRERERRMAELEKSGVPRIALAYCPACRAVMRRRLAGRGPNKGRYFWGCSRYPRCKGTRDIPTPKPQVPGSARRTS